MDNKIELEWSEEASHKLIEIMAYFEDKDPIAGYKIISEIEERSKSIKRNPYLGVTSRKRKDIRRLIIPRTKHFIAYKLLPNAKKPKIAYILAIVSNLSDNEATEYR